jgi:hypothetical protein
MLAITHPFDGLSQFGSVLAAEGFAGRFTMGRDVGA